VKTQSACARVYCGSQVATRAHDPPDPRKIPAVVVKHGVARVQAGEVLELLQADGGPIAHWWRVRRCSLTDRLGEQRKEMEGWILSEYTKRVHADQVAAWLDRAEFRDRSWATAAHHVLSRLRNTEGAQPGSGRELLRNALLQEWDPLQRRVQKRRFILLSGCLLKVSEVPQREEAPGGRSSRWRRSTWEGGQELAGSGSLLYRDSIDLTDEGITVISWGMGLGLKLQVANCVGCGGTGLESQKQWDMYFETVEEADDWAAALQRQITEGVARRRGAETSGGSSLTAPVLPLPFLLADDEPAQQLFPDTLVPR
jgi:hypothetical protein